MKQGPLLISVKLNVGEISLIDFSKFLINMSGGTAAVKLDRFTNSLKLNLKQLKAKNKSQS